MVVGAVCGGSVKDKITYLLGTPVLVTNVLAFLEDGKNLLDGGFLLLELLHLKGLTATTGLLLQVLESLLCEFDILDTELLADNLEITDGVDITLDVNDIGVVERSDHLEDTIDGTDMGQEGVTQPGSGRGSGCKTSNIDTGEVGGDTRGRLVGLAEPVVSWVRDEDTGFLGVDGGIGEVGGVTQRALGNGLEESGFTNVGKADLAFTVNM